MSCVLGMKSDFCDSEAPCIHNGLCYTEKGNIPTHIMKGLRKQPEDQSLLERMAMNCSNTMHQSKGSCPPNCQWLGGKINRCQRKSATRSKSVKPTVVKKPKPRNS